VVAENGNGRDLDDRHFTRERAGFIRKAVVGQIAAKHQDVGALVDLTEKRLQRACDSVSAVMKIANRTNPDDRPG
jgi:hypothetical protein